LILLLFFLVVGPQFAKTNSRAFGCDVHDVTLGSSAIFGKRTFGKRFETWSQDQLEDKRSVAFRPHLAMSLALSMGI
jgi:hypothetical protein